MNGSLFSITRYMNGVCFKASVGTSVPKLPPSYPRPPPRKLQTTLNINRGKEQSRPNAFRAYECFDRAVPVVPEIPVNHCLLSKYQCYIIQV